MGNIELYSFETIVIKRALCSIYHNGLHKVTLTETKKKGIILIKGKVEAFTRNVHDTCISKLVTSVY